jgi:WD40 repeat protein
MQDDFLIAFVTWSPDSRRIAIGGTAIAVDKNSRFTGGAVQILDARTGAQVAERSYPTTKRNGEVLALQYSPDGKYLFIAQIDALEIWDARMTHLQQQIRGQMCAARLSPDGKDLATATLDGRVSVWRLK